MVRQDKANLLFKRPPQARFILVSSQSSEAKMTFTLSEANTYAAATKEGSPTDEPTAPVKNIWSTIKDRFWDFTEETSEGNTKSYEGLL